MKRILLIVIYCVALSTLVACGDNPDKVKFSDNNSTITYGGAVYHEFEFWSGTYCSIIDETPEKIGSIFSTITLNFYPIYVSDYDVDKNILYANTWMWVKEGFEFPDYLTCRLKKIDVWSKYTGSQSTYLISTLWEDEEEYLTLDDIVNKLDPVDDLTDRAEYHLHCYPVDYPYLWMGGVHIYYHDAQVYISITIDFVDTFYKVREEYVPMFDF